MATRTQTKGPTTSRSLFGAVGVGLLVLGLIGVGIWAVMAVLWSDMAAEGTVVADVAEIGVEDPVNDPGVWTGKDDSGQVVWEGTEEEWADLSAEARAAHQADLSNTWLFPSAAVALIGLGIMVFDRRRTRVDATRL